MRTKKVPRKGYRRADGTYVKPTEMTVHHPGRDEVGAEPMMSVPTNDPLVPDLHAGVDMSGADLSNQDLRGAEVQDGNFSGANLSGSDLRSVHAPRANFSGADLRDVKFRGANIEKANFEGADLRGASMTGAARFNAKLDGALVDERTEFDTNRWQVDSDSRLRKHDNPTIPAH